MNSTNLSEEQTTFLRRALGKKNWVAGMKRPETGFNICELNAKTSNNLEYILSQHSLYETHLDVVRGLIELRGFHPSASISGPRRSDAATSDKDKQICFMLMPRT